MREDIQSVLIAEHDIRDKVTEMGRRITKDYAGKHPVFISVLKGSFVFMADLVRAVDLPVTIDFLIVSSYGNRAESAGEVKILKDLDIPCEGLDIIIVEDILDSGRTLSYIMNLLKARNPASIRIATLLDKPARRRVEIAADYVGFTTPDEFLVGYGLDYAERYRNLPYIGVLKPSVYAE